MEAKMKYLFFLIVVNPGQYDWIATIFFAIFVAPQLLSWGCEEL